MKSAGAILGATFILMLSCCSHPIAQNVVLAEIPIELARNKTVIPVTVENSGPLRLILDSGMGYDGILLYDTAKVVRTQFRNLAEVHIRGAGPGGASRALSDSAATFFVGPRRFANQRVTMLTTDAFKGFPTDGIIGYSLLGHYAVELDYDLNRMILYEPSTFSPGAGWESIDIFFKDNWIPWIDISMATAGEAPVRLSAYIDCASGEALELLERETNSFTAPTEYQERYIGRGISGDIYGKEGRISTLRLGPFELHDVSAVITPATVRSRQDRADAIIGNDTLRRFNVIFDYAHLKIHLRPNRRFTEPFG